MNTVIDNELLAKLDEWLNVHRAEFVRDVISLVNIKSVRGAAEPGKPFGTGPANAIDKGAELGDAYGYETENDGYYTLSFLRKGKTNRELGIIGHVDVVPEGSGWTFEPYNAIERDGWIIGRGSGDNKGPSVAALYVLRALDALGIELNRGVRVIWGADEESDMGDVKHYVETRSEFPDFTIVCDAGFSVSIGEKSVFVSTLVYDIGADTNLMALNAGSATNAIPDYAEITYTGKPPQATEGIDIKTNGYLITLSARGDAGHASRPEGKTNAIYALTKAVTDAKLLTGKAYDAVKAISEILSDHYGVGVGIESEDDISGKTTHIGGIIKYENGKISQTIDARCVIKMDVNDIAERLKAHVTPMGFTVEDIRVNRSRYTDPESAEVKLLADISRQMLGEHSDEPYIMGGGTHAKYFPNSVPFGPSQSNFETPYGTAHCADEAQNIDELLTAIKVYVVALMKLDELYGI
ncbi:MAG: Sapep family Mn(2+)-dependent dipeptidase [Oscillospiraceae bacterium]|jgi:succinyl-diaminopimelate desuccinylase|nr:Sapep family Mn(2+)-dependent dipeptidase [Oscillospiraceae bacterium]